MNKKALAIISSAAVTAVTALIISFVVGPSAHTQTGASAVSAAPGLPSSPALGSPSPTATTRLAVPSLAITAPQDFPGVGASVKPAPSGAVAPLSQVAVLAILQTNDLVKTTTDKTATPNALSLVLYTNRFGDIQSAQPDIPSVPLQLAWFAEYDGVPGVRHLPVGAPSDQSSQGICKVFVAISGSSETGV